MIKNRKILLFFSFFCLGLFLVGLRIVLAGDIVGISEVDSEIVLKATDPRTIVVKIINIFLGLLAIIAVSLTIYGGFLWMTSEGNEEKVDKAKRLLKSAIIGLAIILISWGIVTFIFRSLFPDNYSNQGVDTSRNAFFQTGLGAIGNCSVESVYPEPDQENVPRNTMIMITFKEEVASTSISNSSVVLCEEDKFDIITRACSEPISFSFSTADNKTFVFYPDNLLGNENGFSKYLVYFSSDVLKIDESASIFSNCSANFFLWGFEVSNLLDLTPPEVGSVFPQADDAKDEKNLIAELLFATASLGVLGEPNYFQPASIVSISNIIGTATATADINPNYNGDYLNFNVVVDLNRTKAQLSSGGSNLGLFDIVDNEINFVNYFKMELDPSFTAGSSWSVVVKKRILADFLTVGSYVYTFINGSSNAYNISVNSNPIVLAQEISVVLANHPNINVSYQTGTTNINLTAKVGGVSGNSIALSSSNSSAISVVPFSGGGDKSEQVVINDKKDQPMNSIVQINFNEAVNPLMVSGNSDDIYDYIKIINKSASAKASGQACVEDNECQSYNCDGTVCVGNYLAGNFSISSNYKTVEFQSDVKCGVNGCGEDIYCLPANSNLEVQLKSASLFDCQGDDANCLNKSPFLTCTDNICVNSQAKRYPLSNLSSMDGIMDSAGNSFDGNGDGYSYGPATFYNLNSPDINMGDNLRWSFWISDKIETDPPIISNISPAVQATAVDLYDPIIIEFNKLMMASSLKTGAVTINNGVKDVVHSLINLISGQLVGYWISSKGLDIDPVDGEPDKTSAYINHGKFFEGADYKSRVGSGVKDVYQNCFKPSVGPGCTATPAIPFCCNGAPSVTPCD